MSNVILLSQFSLLRAEQDALALAGNGDKIVGHDLSAEQLRDHLATVTTYLEKLRLHIEALSISIINHRE